MAAATNLSFSSKRECFLDPRVPGDEQHRRGAGVWCVYVCVCVVCVCVCACVCVCMCGVCMCVHVCGVVMHACVECYIQLRCLLMCAEIISYD